MPVKPPPRRAARPGSRASLIPLLGLVLVGLAALGAGHALLWRWAGDRVVEGFETWARTRRAAGWQVQHGTPERGGWPFAATLRLPAFRLAGGGATLPGGMEWQAEAVVLRVALPRFDRLRVEASGPQRLRLAAAEIPFAADRLEVAMPLESGVLPREADLYAERLRLRAAGAAGAAGAAVGAVEVERAEAHLETSTTAIEGEPAVLLTLSAEGIALPPPAPGPGGAASSATAANPLPRRAESLAGELVLTGPIPAGREPAARAEAWREAGGTLELRSLSLRWGPVEAEAQATLTLDDALQPMGAGTVRLTGVGPAIEALAAGGAITPRGALTARAVLGLLARTPPEGGPARVELPLTLEERTLTLGGQLQLLRLPPLAWPSGGGGAGEAPAGPSRPR